MNRIYQGRVTAIERPNPDKSAAAEQPWIEVPHWEDTLWEHHVLFQDAVNYYTLALAALAEGLTADTERGAAALAWRRQVRTNWCDGERRGEPYAGPHKRLAGWLGVDPNIADEGAAFDASARAILRSNGSTASARAAALLQLLDEADASDLNQLAVGRLPWLASPKEGFGATSRSTIAKQEAERIRQTQAVHAATEETLPSAVEQLEPGRFVTQMPEKQFKGAEARDEALRQFRSAAAKAKELAGLEPAFDARLAELGDALCVPQLGRKPSGYYPFALVLRLWPTPATWSAFKSITRNLAKKSVEAEAADRIAEVRVGGEPVFEYFTNRVLVRAPGNADRAVWFEFDLAAFIEAIKAPHRYFQDTQSRAADARRIAQRLHAIDPETGWLGRVPAAAAPAKGSAGAQTDERDEGLDFTFAGDSRVKKLREVLTNLAKYADEPNEEGPAGLPGYTIQERTLRGWKQVRELWRKQAKAGTATIDSLKKEVARIQAEHRDDFGSATLFDELAKPENHEIWRDPPSDPERHADDLMRAWMQYVDLCWEFADTTREIRFTPAFVREHETGAGMGSPRFYILPKTGRFGTKHERVKDGELAFRFRAGLIFRTTSGWEPQTVRFVYSAPRLRRDGLRLPGEADLSEARWLPPMLQALGVGDPDKQDLSGCRVTLQPVSRKNHQLTFPVEIESEALQKALGTRARWFGQFNQYPDGDGFYPSSLRWPHEKRPAKAPDPWAAKLGAFTVLSVDLGQRDAGAFALLDVRANDTFGGRPARFIGETDVGGEKKAWRAALVTSGLMRLSGEDRKEWRDASRHEQKQGQQGFGWREELYGERGRCASEAESFETHELFAELGVLEEKLMPPNWRTELSFPEQNDKLLFAARRCQSLVSKLHRWAWLLTDAAKTEQRGETLKEVAESSSPGTDFESLLKELAELAAKGDADALLQSTKAELQKRLDGLSRVMERLTSRVLPLRSGTWCWRLTKDRCHVMMRETTPLQRIPIRGQRGLSFERIEQLEQLRKRLQSLNQSQRRLIGGPMLKRRDDSVPDPCPAILEKLDRLKTQRVNQTAHMILAEALGVRLGDPAEDKRQTRQQCDQHGRYRKVRPPVDFVVIEDLARYRASQGRAPRENSRLMKWCHRAIRAKLRELCEPFGIPVVETLAAWSSRFCARSGVPGFRAVEVTAGFTKTGLWRRATEPLADGGAQTPEAAWLQDTDKKLGAAQAGLEAAWKKQGKAAPCPRRTLLVPQSGGPVFVPLCDSIADPEHPKLQPKPVQADINAAINLGLRAIADPRQLAVHPRVRTERDAESKLRVKERRRYGPRSGPIVRDLAPDQAADDSSRNPNYFADRSGTIAEGRTEIPDAITGKPVGVVLGVAMWKRVRATQRERCEAINHARLAAWDAKLGDVPME